MQSTPIILLAPGAQTGSANGATMDVSGAEELLVFLHRTTASGTITAFSVFVETSDDGGSTWSELCADSLVTTTGAAADVTATKDKRNLVTETTLTSTDLKALARYSNFGSKVRVRWLLTGTTPSETFGVNAIIKS
jgi:hypothetical protein